MRSVASRVSQSIERKLHGEKHRRPSTICPTVIVLSPTNCQTKWFACSAVHVNRMKWRDIYVQSPDHCEARRLLEHANDRRILAGQKFPSQQRPQPSWAQTPSKWKTPSRKNR